MADTNSGAPPSPSQRRKSFVEMLNPRAFGNGSSISAAPATAIPVPSSPGVSGNRKSMSMALGLSGSANSQDSPFNAFARQRRASISTSTASGSPEFRNSFEDNAVIEEDDRAGPMNAPPSPSFARRLSFGAQALRDAKQGGAAQGGINAGEGFNWSDAMRDRNKRASVATTNPFSGGHNRTKSMNAHVPEPPKEIPQAPAAPSIVRTKKPDHLGERMLRGDFMMD